MSPKKAETKKRKVRPAVKRKPKKRGRPTKRTPKKILDAVKYLEIGLSERTASDMIGIDFSTWIRWKKADPIFATTLLKAKTGAIVKATTKLVEGINGGNTACIIFFLKSRAEEFRYSANGNNSKQPTPSGIADTTELIKAMDCITKLERSTSKVSRSRTKKS